MKKEKTLFKKVMAVTLIVITSCITLLSTAQIFGLIVTDSYVRPLEQVSNNVLEEFLYDDFHRVQYMMSITSKQFTDDRRVVLNPEELTNRLNGSYQYSNLKIRIFEADTAIYELNMNAQSRFNAMIDNQVQIENSNNAVHYRVEVSVMDDFEYNDRYAVINWIVTLAYRLRFAVYPILIVSLIALFSSIVYLMNQRKTNGLKTLDKIPLELVVGLYILVLMFAQEVSYHHYELFFLVVLLVMSLILIQSVMRRIKYGVFYKNTLIHKIASRMGYVLRDTSMTVKVGLGLIVNAIVDLILIIVFQFVPLNIWIFLLIKNILIGYVVLRHLIEVHDITLGTETIALGHLDFKFDVHNFQGPLRKLTMNLNQISNATANAVSEQMKSERMKTDLITNVSHDIKTPITSIINYVDLLRETDDLNLIGEYTTVLQRQSDRLKHLVEDLIEASKLSSGNVELEAEPTDVNVLLTQFVGEYEEKLETKGLTLIYNSSVDVGMIAGDGQQLSRLFNNIFENALLYSLENTRVYLTLDEKNGTYITALKSISKAALNMDSEELMERFTRADSSRNTEGSGLGLSIAKGIVELHKGTFDIEIDGDLFKVNISLPKLVD